MTGVDDLDESTQRKWMSYFGWSVSRQNLWDTCSKAYYYQYIHLWKLDWDEKDRFKVLKNLQTAPLVHGIHISDILRKILNTEIQPNVNDANSIFESEMQETFKKGEYRLTELYNGLDMSSGCFERHIEYGKMEIGNFITTIYPFVKNMEMKVVDKIDKYEMEGRSFYSAPDFLGVDDEEVWHLIDWKSGKGTGTKTSFLDMQLTTYACYVIHYICGGKRPASMKLYVIFLQDMSKNVEKYLTEDMLAATKRKMIEMHDAILEKSMNGPFPASPEQRKCRFCNYATICDEGKSFLE